MQQNNLVPRNRIVLYYQGYCKKCQILSKMVVLMSFNFIKRIPLEVDDSIKLFFDDYPKAKGYPILFLGSRPVYNYWVFPAVPFAIVLSWFYTVRSMVLSERAAPLPKSKNQYPPFFPN
ncbi:hypothetical protein SAMN05216490_2249 [Mucilaginibacter mallensis]|uniref:Thioredoxin n=1 Tax=Mucilaginibacter mallensis TaxID=652787 RepID=A0A1H1WQ17_MUCMA|nr:hypothetical protein [Mucilaginibacter mallensis]SDS99174.1 hypothetical protein SAMN05216490_2249 [Mucilaginibacter mallensis]